LQIDNSNGIIAQFDYEQPLPLQINGHVIHPATHVAQWDFGFELEQTCIR
jgi:hypothetical protein